MTRVERFQKEIRQLIRQIDATAQFTNGRCMSITYLPNDPAAASFLEDAKMSGTSPLSQYVRTLHERMRQRIDALTESSVLVGEHSSVFRSKIDGGGDDEDDDGNEKGAAVFSSSWLPSKPKAKPSTEEKRKRKKKVEHDGEVALDKDVVEDLMLSSDEDGSLNDSSSADEKENTKSVPHKIQNKKQKPSQNSAKSFPVKPNMKSSMNAPSDGKGRKRKGKEHKAPAGFSKNNSRSPARKSKKRRVN